MGTRMTRPAGADLHGSDNNQIMVFWSDPCRSAHEIRVIRVPILEGEATFMDAAVVEVRGVTKAFGSGEARVQALRGVDLVLRRGEFVAVMGASGSGKSTLLHLIGALDTADGGTIRVGGADLSQLDDDGLTLLRRKSIGFIFQSF